MFTKVLFNSLSISIATIPEIAHYLNLFHDIRISWVPVRSRFQGGVIKMKLKPTHVTTQRSWYISHAGFLCGQFLLKGYFFFFLCTFFYPCFLYLYHLHRLYVLPLIKHMQRTWPLKRTRFRKPQTEKNPFFLLYSSTVEKERKGFHRNHEETNKQ